MSDHLQTGFVYLDEVDSSIVQSIRYSSSFNFMGCSIDGYISGRAIMTRVAALALQKVQNDVIQDRLSLIVYDSYRPQRAVEHFVRWSHDYENIKSKADFYPFINKNELFRLGYIAEKSSHSRGSTVDVSLIEFGHEVKSCYDVESKRLNDGRMVPYLNDGSIDMYTSFDLFDKSSMHDSDLIPPENLAHREYLKQKMKKHGFEEYAEEWWHYTFIEEPFPDDYFNFDA